MNRIFVLLMLYALCVGAAIAQSSSPSQIGDVTPELVIIPGDSFTIQENEPIIAQLQIIDPRANPYVFSVTPEVENSDLDETGIFRFLPSFIQSGTYEFHFTASDEIEDLTATLSVLVQDQNRPPELQLYSLKPVDMDEGESITMQAVAFDPDLDDTLVYSVDPLLDNMTLDSSTGIMTFSPDYTQAGEYQITFRVTDGEESDQLNVKIRVEDRNFIPILYLNPEEGRAVKVGETFNLQAFATDIDEEDQLTYSISGAPSNSTFDINSGRFSFTPTLEQFREQYEITIDVTDGEASDSKTIMLNVTADVYQIFEFNQDNYTEEWYSNSYVIDTVVEEGYFKGILKEGNPIIYRSGFRVDTFSQKKLLIRLFVTQPASLEVSYTVTNEYTAGPAVQTISKTSQFVTYVFDIDSYFDEAAIVDTIRLDIGDNNNYFMIDYIAVLQSSFKKRTPTPFPISTPSVTPTPTVTQTPTPTATVTPTPTPLLIEDITYEFDEHDGITNHFDLMAPAGYKQALIFPEQVAESDLFSGYALSVIAPPGAGAFIISKATMETFDKPVSLQVSALTNSASAAIAVVALNAPIDGQLAYNNVMNGVLTPGVESQLQLYYEPPNNIIQLAVQIANPPNAPGNAMVMFDNLSLQSASTLIHEATATLEPAGSFDEDVDDVISNVNVVDGSVQVVNTGDRNQAILLSINKRQIAANIAVNSYYIDDHVPGFYIAQVEASRVRGREGMLGFVLTNSDSTVALYQKGETLTPYNSPKRFRFGGNILAPSSFFKPILVFQNAGLAIESSVLIDNFRLWQSRTTQE